MIEFKKEMEKDTEEDETLCVFIKLLSNCHEGRTTDLINLSKTCLQTVIEASKKCKDNLDIHDDKEIMVHKACLLE